MSGEPFPSPLADMLIRDGAVAQPSVAGELMRERFSGDRRIRQVETVWVADGRLPGSGRWEIVEEFDVGPAPA